MKRVLAVIAIVVATGIGDATAQTGSSTAQTGSSSTPGPSSHVDRSGPGPDGKVVYLGPAPATQARVGFTG